MWLWWGCGGGVVGVRKVCSEGWLWYCGKAVVICDEVTCMCLVTLLTLVTLLNL